MDPQGADLPAAYALHLVDLVARFGVPAAELLEGFPFSRDALMSPSLRLSLATANALIERAQALTGEPGLGFSMGLQMRLSSHGYLGFAAMTAGTVREAIALALRFIPTRTLALGLALHVEGDRASLVLEERVDLGRGREFILTALMIGIAQIGNAVTNTKIAGDADLIFDEPAYFRRFAHLAPGRVRFGQPSNRLVFDASALDLPLEMADPVAMELAREQCEREMQALGRTDRLALRVRELLSLPEGFRTLEEVARELHVSPRTLKRRLAEQGTSYSDELDAARRERAMLLLRDGKLSRDEIAEKLGYSDPANFARAFRRWTGKTPARARRD